MKERDDIKKTAKILRITVLSAISVLMIIAGIIATKWVLTLRDPTVFEEFQQKVMALGIWGFALLLIIQYLQIVIAFIPGGPIQITAGALYGPAGGLAICLLGTILASITVFILVSRYGQNIISLFVEEGEIKQYKFLDNSKRLEFLVIILFFIPGTPKDALTYLFALTSINMWRFIFLATTARIPAMVTSIFAGDSVRNGEWSKAVILFVIISAIGFVGILLQRKVMAHYTKHQ